MAAIDQPPAIVCSVVSEQEGERVQFRGRVLGQEAAQGVYSLLIVKSGPSGSSNVRQGGPMSLSANTETFVGLASFNAEPGATFTVEFSVRVGDRTYACRS